METNAPGFAGHGQDGLQGLAFQQLRCAAVEGSVKANLTVAALGGLMLVGLWPMVMCDEGIELIDDCRSKDSAAVIDDFVRAFLGAEAVAAGRGLD